MQRSSHTDQICSTCWNRAIDAFGTGEIFLKRGQKNTNLLKAISFSGIVVPLVIGGVVLGFGTGGNYLNVLLPIAASVGIVQLVFSTFSIVYNWADELQYSLESATENFSLSLRFKELGEQASNPPNDINLRFTSLKVLDEARQAADIKKHISPKELRYGHRAGLRQFSRACATCKEVPISMKASKCQTCGGF